MPDRTLSNGVIRPSFEYVAFTNLIWYCVYVLNVVKAGFVIIAIITSRGSRWSSLQRFTIAAYSFIPFFVAGQVAA
jgi:hypothetical protein